METGDNQQKPSTDGSRADPLRLIERQLVGWDKWARLYQRIGGCVQITQVLLAAGLPILIIRNAPRTIDILVSIILALLVMAAPVWQFDSKARFYWLAASTLKKALYKYKFSDSGQEKEAQLRKLTDLISELITEPDSRWLQSVYLERGK
jgi:hypothetical protein